MADDPSTWGSIEGVWKNLAPLKAPISENAPLSENVEDRRVPETMLDMIMRSVRHVDPHYTDENNPLVQQLMNAARRGDIRGTK